MPCMQCTARPNVWSLGNEPDLYIEKWRSSNYTVKQYESDWQTAAHYVKKYVQVAYPDMIDQCSFWLDDSRCELSFSCA
jgi:hypothetical protein